MSILEQLNNLYLKQLKKEIYKKTFLDESNIIIILINNF